MDINEIKIGQAKELATMFGGEARAKKDLYSILVGKYVIVRSRNEGINAGFVKDVDETGVILTLARRIWYHRPKDKSMSWYEGVAMSGLSEDSKVSCEVGIKAIIEDYSMTVCSEAAMASIRGHKTHEQS